jgi:hypothetical protein
VLTLQFPMLLALLGTALMAVVIFAPSRAPASCTTSYAPPPAPPPFEQWQPPPLEAWDAPAEPEVPVAAPETATWPALVDRRAAGCDAAARLDVVEALAAVRTAWSESVLRCALDDEPDAAVRDAVAAALGARAANDRASAGRYPAGLA